jgi:hypothetical protein
MAGLLSITEANDLLDSKFGSGSPASWDIAILISEPPRSAVSYVEVSGGSYARVTKTNNSTNFPAASAAVKKNGTVIDFGTATADWGTSMYGLGFFNGSTLEAWAEFTTPQTVLNGYSFSIPINALVISA